MGIPTVGEALEEMKRAFRDAGLDEPGADAEFLLTHILGVKRHQLYTDHSRPLTREQTGQAGEYTRRRLGREPCQHITGEVEFRGLALTVTPDVLIPRPETELLVDTALEELSPLPEGPVADVCTGSGCVAVTLAVETGRRVYATDNSPAALTVARKNAERQGVDGLVDFLEGDLLAPVRDLGVRPVLITSNPPYVPSSDMEGLEPEVRDFEPPGALDGGEDGLDVVRRLLAEAREIILPGGALVMEIGWGQRNTVRELATAAGWASAELRRDFSGIDRVVVARAPGPAPG